MCILEFVNRCPCHIFYVYGTINNSALYPIESTTEITFNMCIHKFSRSCLICICFYLYAAFDNTLSLNICTCFTFIKGEFVCFYNGDKRVGCN